MTTKYESTQSRIGQDGNCKLSLLFNPTWHKTFFGGFDMPGRHTSGTFMSSKDLVTHQTHKNG